jgi:ubiquinone/menaquinone biosynthesis C-methylase UbiE
MRRFDSDPRLQFFQLFTISAELGQIRAVAENVAGSGRFQPVRSISLRIFTMNRRIKLLIKQSLPQGAIQALQPVQNLGRTLEKRRTQRLFAASGDTPSSLDINELARLQKTYPYPPPHGYDAQTLENRGMQRATEILHLQGAQRSNDFLELGCWDGMVSCALSCKGKHTTAIDSRDLGFDERAYRQGVNFFQMNAADLRFEDESFDFVFSYDAFEHFTSPDAVLKEAIRVVRNGGFIYLEFGPLYYSPLGEHAYRSITVPYCQFLFTKSMINDFTAQHGLEPIDFSHVNGWSIERFRDLWDKNAHVLKKIKYYETINLSHLNLINAYPSCFKSKSSYFDNFIVSNISVLFQKTSSLD